MAGIFVFDPARFPLFHWLARSNAFQGLNSCFFIYTDQVELGLFQANSLQDKVTN